ncbi:MAG: exonuclease domain-containing protein [Anaerolineae bacterium]|nr:exonuclease domain-containing protein [Anaerolineae bacterium]
MTIKHDQIIVVDIEATCWENNAAPPGEHSEIIEVGVCLLDTHTFEASQRLSILVRPEHSQISPFCTQLTTLTPEMIAAQGIAFGEACAMLEDRYESRGRLWASWGNYDKRIFHEQSQAMNVRYPFSDHHVNVRKLFSKFEKHKNPPGMTGALEILGLTLEGTHHRGGDDAWNIAKIMGVLLQKHSVAILKKYW